MSKEIKLNFYDETFVVNINKKEFKDIKGEIAKKYVIDPTDVNELIIYYFDQDKIKHFIRNDIDFKKLDLEANKGGQIVVYLEIHEESRLFKQQNQNNNIESSETAEKIRKEILEKEIQLKKTIEKERQEIQKKKEEAKKKAEEEKRKGRLDELRMKKYALEKEEILRKSREKAELEIEVSKLMNENLEKMKKQLIENTVNQSLQLVDKQLEKRLQVSQCKDVHNYTCSSCNASPIIGFRYSCGIIPDFHLCENCEYFVGDSHPYPLLKYRTSKQGAMKFKFILEGNTNNVYGNTKQDDDIILLENFNKR